MKRVLLLLSIIVAACAGSPQRPQDLVDRAVGAMGGADALGGVKTLSVKLNVRQWEPEQSLVAGADPRFCNEAEIAAVADIPARSVRVEWVKNFQYPTPRTFKYTEIVTPDAGYVIGIDSNGRNKQSLSSDPPAHTMSGVRLAATQRELKRASPLLLLEMRANPAAVTAAGAVDIGGTSYPALDYRSGATTFTVLFDPESGLPARIRTRDYDNIQGDSTYDLVLGDWRPVGNIRYPMSQQYLLNGTLITDVKVNEAAVNVPVAADRFAIPANFKATAAKPATGNVPYQWAIRRPMIGTYMDSDNTSYDTQASSGLRLVELAPGVQHQVGGTHNSMIVEMRDYLIVFDAPVSDWQSNWTIRAAKEKYPGKPIKYLVLSHHHMDHAGGFRAYAAEGATLVVGRGNAARFRRLLAVPYTLNPDLAARDLSGTAIIEIADKQVFSDGKRETLALLSDNVHVRGMLIGYVTDARVGFVVDIWSPGTGPLPDKINPALAAVTDTMTKAGVSPLKFAGGHGSVGDYAPLAALASAK